MTTFQMGDVVQLKLGGVRMTVEEIGQDGYVTCVWFDEKRTERQAFPEATLEKYVPMRPLVRTRHNY